MSLPSVSRPAALAAAILVCGCSGFDVEGPPAPAPPSDLRVALSSSAWGWPELQAEWSRPPGAVPDGIVLEMRTGEGPWTQGYWFGGSATAGTLALSQVEDGARLTFRAVAVDNGVRSTPTNQAAVQLPVAAAANAQVGWSVAGPVSVWWQRTSQGATAVRVERRIEPATGPASPWQQVLLASAATTRYDDADTAQWRDGARLAYRIVYLAGDVESEPVEARSPGGRPLALAATAVHDAGVVRVGWTYAGAAPIQVRVTRRPLGAAEVELGVADPPATSFEMPAPPPGFYTYVVQAKSPDASWYDWDLLSTPASASVLVPDPALAGVLEASVIELPEADEVARAPSGAFAVVSGDGWSTLAVHVPTPDGWERWFPATADRVRAARPGVHFDAQGRLHVLYEQETDARHWDVRHRWQDSAGWRDERAGTILALGAGASSSALDAGGDPHLLWQDCCTALGASLPMTYAVRREGAWTEEVFTAPWDTAYATSRIATDPANEPAFLMQGASTLLLRHGSGGWSDEPLPTAGTSGAAWGPVLLPAVDRVVLVGRWSDTSGTAVIGVSVREGSSWSAAEPALAATDSWPAYRAASSPDGTRIAIATTSSPPRVAIRDAGGWTVRPLAAVEGEFALGFTPAGKLWVLMGIGRSTAYADPDRLPHVLYEEP
ncbi:hypothetical protein Anae109_3150 [Anaeromyxobacter sp. Fw109-5]|nr:hypothetical protein Anae109_3150 [Anaeromyxobacter sp. Fw109-5]